MKIFPMIQSTQILSIALLIGGCGMAAPSTAQQMNWRNLTNLVQGDEIKVVVDRGKPQRGTFQSVTDDAITVHFGTGDQTITRQSVGQVLAKGGGHRSKHVLIGMAVGAGAGIGLGTAAYKLQSRQFLDALPVGALVGACVGALLPSGGWKTMYAAGD
jgi:hypothetical protein